MSATHLHEVFASTAIFIGFDDLKRVGKSTCATNIALGVAGVLRRAGAANARVMLIDTDSQ
jgi:hypothetical protein